MIDQIIAVDQVIGQGSQLTLDLLHTHLHRSLLIIAQDRVLKKDTGDDTDQEYENEKKDPQTSQKCQSVKDFFDSFPHKLQDSVQTADNRPPGMDPRKQILCSAPVSGGD